METLPLLMANERRVKMKDTAGPGQSKSPERGIFRVVENVAE